MTTNRKIIHISDIHIGSGKRSKEYRDIFDKLGNEVSKIKPIFVCITGDIFHHKVRYSGEDVDDFYYLMKKISSIVPIIMIPGNHDMNMNNNDGIDLITPLLKEMKNNDNIRYWKESGVYTIFGMSFLHIGVNDVIESEDIIKILTNNPNSILLYHGMVNKAKYGTNIVKEAKINERIMSKAKIVMLGDIHEQQFIRNNIAYAGSLIQQNLGESDRKGYILWDVDKCTGDFISISNNNKFIRLDLRGKTYEECTNIKLKNNNIKDNRTNADILKEILKSKGGTEEQIDVIMKIYGEKLMKQEYRKWSIISVEWDNLYKYGRKNYIDFRKLEGISGVIAKNRWGKSSIIDIIVFGLYGKIMRGTKDTMIHKGEKIS